MSSTVPAQTRPVRQRIPMSAPDISEADIEAVNRVLRTPFLSIGPQIVEFEKRSAAYVGARHAIGVSSGTAGLHLCVIAAGVQEGDYVITTPFSFVSSANVILYERAIPIFVDVDEATGNIDPAQVSGAIDDLDHGGRAARRRLPGRLAERGAPRGRVAAILPVHAFGQPADMDPILEAARRHHLPVIEDACEAIGARYKGRMAGALGDAGVFAFYPNKQMTTGEGGMIVTNRRGWEPLFRSLRNQGRDVFDSWLNHSRLGYNYRLDEMSAALGASQMGRLDELLAKRERVAGWYHARLQGIAGVQPPHVAPSTSRMVRLCRAVGPADRSRSAHVCPAGRGHPHPALLYAHPPAAVLCRALWLPARRLSDHRSFGRHLPGAPLLRRHGRGAGRLCLRAPGALPVMDSVAWHDSRSG